MDDYMNGPYTLKGLKDIKKKELEVVQEFFETGICRNGNYDIYLDDERLIMYGINWGEGNVVLAIKDGKLLVPQRRSEHLQKSLEDFALQEGLEMVYSGVQVNRDNLVRVAYWNFKSRKEVDDTELVGKTSTRIMVQSDPTDESPYISPDLTWTTGWTTTSIGF